jgi:hypothetical protein
LPWRLVWPHFGRLWPAPGGGRELGRVASGGGVVGEGLPGETGGGPGGLAARSRIAGYVLEEEIGAGGIAVVFRARDERLGGLRNPARRWSGL